MKNRCDLEKQVWAVLGVGLIFVTSLAGASLENERLVFSLPDIYGREVRSQDYKGVPVFLEFGACW